MPRYVFFDLDNHIVKNYIKVLGSLPGVDVIQSDVRSLENPHIYVSPANSYGWMDGGIDEVYMEMFPTIQKEVMTQIGLRSGQQNIYKRACLPVGSALVIDIPDSNHQLVCAPTMLVPSKINKRSENVYYAMIAILEVTKHLPDDVRVMVPGLGTGVGQLNAIESAREILSAFIDHREGNQEYKYPTGTQITHEIPTDYIVHMPPKQR